MDLWTYMGQPASFIQEGIREGYDQAKAFSIHLITGPRSAFMEETKQSPASRSYVFLEHTQALSEPRLLQHTVDLNPGHVIFARRFYIWDDENYRRDGFFAPTLVPIVIPGTIMANGPRWPEDSFYPEVISKPYVTAPFDIQDYRFRGLGDLGRHAPSLRKYDGTLVR